MIVQCLSQDVQGCVVLWNCFPIITNQKVVSADILSVFVQVDIVKNSKSKWQDWSYPPPPPKRPLCCLSFVVGKRITCSNVSVASEIFRLTIVPLFCPLSWSLLIILLSPFSSTNLCSSNTFWLRLFQPLWWYAQRSLVHTLPLLKNLSAPSRAILSFEWTSPRKE